MLVQLVLWYNLSALMPEISFGIPFGPEFLTADTNKLITPLLAAILGLGLNEGAYMAEIIRGGLMSVDPGQTEAASALGMSARATFRRIVLPQAMRFIVPPTGNQLISMLKATSLVSVIALADLLYTVQSIYNRTFQTHPAAGRGLRLVPGDHVDPERRASPSSSATTRAAPRERAPELLELPDVPATA